MSKPKRIFRLLTLPLVITGIIIATFVWWLMERDETLANSTKESLRQVKSFLKDEL